MANPLFTRRQFVASAVAGVGVSSGCLSLPESGPPADQTRVLRVFITNTDSNPHDYTAILKHEGEVFLEDSGTVEASKDGVAGNTMIANPPQYTSNISVKSRLDGQGRWSKFDTSQTKKECIDIMFAVHQDGGLGLFIPEGDIEDCITQTTTDEQSSIDLR